MSTSYVHHRRAPIRHRQQRRMLALPLIAGGAVVVAATAFIMHVLLPGWHGAPIGPNAPSLPVTVAGVAFNVPPAAIRVATQRQPGAHDRIDLGFLWPSLQPPDSAPLPNVPAKGRPKQQSFERVFLTIATARDSLPPLERVKMIYPRYIESEPSVGRDGLAVVAFRQGTPYQGEDLIFDAANPEKFLVRCSRNGAAAMLGTCLSVRRIGEAELTVRFPRDWLDDWRSVASNIELLITKIRPHGS